MTSYNKTATDEKVSCCVCLSESCDKMFQCEHITCKACVTQMRSMNRITTCPLCRSNLKDDHSTTTKPQEHQEHNETCWDTIKKYYKNEPITTIAVAPIAIVVGIIIVTPYTVVCTLCGVALVLTNIIALPFNVFNVINCGKFRVHTLGSVGDGDFFDVSVC